MTKMNIWAVSNYFFLLQKGVKEEFLKASDSLQEQQFYLTIQ